MSTSRVIAKVQARVRRGWTDTEWELRHLGLEEMGEYLTNKLGWTETQADMALKKLRMPGPWKLDREAAERPGPGGHPRGLHRSDRPGGRDEAGGELRGLRAARSRGSSTTRSAGSWKATRPENRV